MYTQEEVESVFIECYDILRNKFGLRIISKISDYKVELNKSVHTAGKCSILKRRISVSIKCEENSNIKGLKNTIIHELFHAMSPKDGHKGKWREYVDIYNKDQFLIAQTGKIERCYNSEDNEINENNYRYKLICPDCGEVFYRINKNRSMNFKTMKYNGYHRGCENLLNLEII